MITLPGNAEPINVTGATVEFLTFRSDDATYYAFDTSRCGPPEPMINAMAGLRLLDAPDKKLIMINHKSPMGLFDKIGTDFDIQTQTLEDGRIMVIFGYKHPVALDSDRYGPSCHG